MQTPPVNKNIVIKMENLAAISFAIYVFGFYFQLALSELLNLPSLSVVYRAVSLGLVFAVLVSNCKKSITKTELLSLIVFYLIVCFYLFSVLRGMYSLYSFGTDPFVILTQLIFSVCIFIVVLCVANINLSLFIRFSFYLNLLTLSIVLTVNGTNLLSLLGRLRTEDLNPILISMLILFNLAALPVVFRKSRLTRLFFKLIFVILTYLSFSKGPILGYLVFLVTRYKILLIALPLIFLLLLNTSFLTKEANSESTNTRLQLYGTSISQIDNHAVLGLVPENMIFNYAPHNIILELFLSTGVYGTTLFLVLVMLVLSITVRKSQNDESATVVNALFYISFVVSLFSGAFYMQSMLFFAMALIIRRQYSN